MATPATPAIELTLKDGTVVKAPSAEEAFKTVVKMYEDTKEHFKGKTDQLAADLEAQRAEVARLAQQSRPQPTNHNGFNNEAYYKLLNDDPIKAQNYLDSYRFGIANPDEVPGYFQSMDRKISAFDQQLLAASFVQQHEDFPQTAETSKELTARVADLRNQGYPVTLDTMNMAYSQLVGEGKIKPIEKRAQEPEELPPSPGGSGAVMADSEVRKAENMNDADLEKFLREKGVLK